MTEEKKLKVTSVGQGKKNVGEMTREEIMKRSPALAMAFDMIHGPPPPKEAEPDEIPDGQARALSHRVMEDD